MREVNADPTTYIVHVKNTYTLCKTHLHTCLRFPNLGNTAEWYW